MKVVIICPMEEEIGYYKEHLGLVLVKLLGQQKYGQHHTKGTKSL